MDGTEARFANGASVTSDLHMSTFPQRAPDFVVAANITNKLGLVPVNLQTNRVVGRNNVFVIGDACHAPLPAVKKAHPKVLSQAVLCLFWIVVLC